MPTMNSARNTALDMRMSFKLSSQRRLGSFIVAGLIFLCLGSPLSAAEVSNDWIQSVQIEGLDRLSLSREFAELPLKTRVGQHYQKADTIVDVNALYLTGYFESVVVRTDPTPAGVAVVYKVVENPVIESVVITGNYSYSTDYLQSVMQSKAGSVMNLKRIEADKMAIDALYAKDGYSLFLITGIALQNRKTLLVRVNEGLIEKISFTGLKAIPEFVVRRELMSAPGTAFNQRSIQRDRGHLLRLGYFSEVGVPSLGTSGAGLEVGFPVIEKKVNLVDLGLETDERDFVGYVQGRVNHVFQTTDVVSVKTQVGLEDRQLRAKSYSVRYFQPWFLNRWPIQFALDAWTDNQVDLGGSPRQIGNRQGWDVVFKFPIKGDEIALSTTLKSEEVIPNSITRFKISSVAGRFLYESPEHLENDESGSYGFVEYQKTLNLPALSLVGLSYSKYSFQWATFFPLAPSMVFGINSNIGYYDTLDPMDPAFQIIQFRIGGSNSLRGYPEGGTTGIKHVLFNGEYRFAMSPNLQGLIFSDFGNAFGAGQPIDLKLLKSSVGLGIRFHTPVGAVRSDFSWGENFVIHLNIGQLF